MGAGLNGPLTGAILAGGQATRLGGVAKGLLDVGGQRIIDRVAGALDPFVDEFLIMASASDASNWMPGTRVVADILPGGGSAAGVHASLRAAKGAVFVAAWDLPFIVPAVVGAIVEKTLGREDEMDAVVAIGPRPGTPEPLCGWYGPACAAAIETGWTAGDRSLRGLLSRVRTVIVPANVIVAIGPPERLFFNVNSAVDLAQARVMAGIP